MPWSMMNNIAIASGLSLSTVKELLEKGWVFESNVGEPAKWLSPVVRMKV